MEKDIREIIAFLIEMLNHNGLSHVTQEVQEEVEEEFNDKKITPLYFFEFYMNTTINILERRSNRNFDALLEKFNRVLENKTWHVGSIMVEIHGNNNDPIRFDLRELPDYAPLIDILKKVKETVIGQY